ncbi:HAD family hydrolase [Paenibacillaceae bacterium]|nr:HAD family hydrolase [Paenibacillaceae bacterium]
MYKHLIFDLDGTLIDTEDAIIQSLDKVVQNYLGKQCNEIELHFALGIPGRDALELLGITDVQRALDEWDRYLKEYQHLINIFPGIEQTLHTLQEQGVSMGIVTSKTRQELKDDFLHMDASHHFPVMICADDTIMHKPNPEPLLAYMNRCGIEPHTAIYIGDTRYDRDAAHGAALDFALAGWGAKAEVGGAKYILQQPSDLLQLIART